MGNTSLLPQLGELRFELCDEFRLGLVGDPENLTLDSAGV